ncbi:MAG: hypothetical protein L0L22_15510 [Staphylococcus equorum]|nr:hypothetical protein [Tetragenococcus koreensis]MDN6572388.1 hypothetical protein [Staphylococcus equorum]
MSIIKTTGKNHEELATKKYTDSTGTIAGITRPSSLFKLSPIPLEGSFPFNFIDRPSEDVCIMHLSTMNTGEFNN